MSLLTSWNLRLRCTRTWALPAIALAAFAAACGGPGKTTPPPEATVESIRAVQAPDGRMNVAELEAEVQGAAGHQVQRIIQATDLLSIEATTAFQRSRLNRVKIRRTEMLLDIATGPNAVAALLDLVVTETLGRMVIEEHGETIIGMPVEPLVEALREGESDMWAIAGKVLSTTQQDELRELIEEWRQQYPNDLYTSDVRFADFAQSRFLSALAEADAPGGLLAPLRETNREVAEMRLMAERAMTRAKFMPMLVRWHVIQIVYEALEIEEVKTLMGQSERSVVALERYADSLEQLPDNISRERDATIKQAAAAIAEERVAVVDHLMGRVTEERINLLADLESRAGPAQSTLRELTTALEAGNQLAQSLNQTIESAAALMPPPSAEPAEPGKPFDVADYGAVVGQVTGAAGELTLLVDSLNEFIAAEAWEARLPQLTGAVGDVGDEGEKLIGRIFILGLVLVIILLAGSVVARLVYLYLARKLFGKVHG